ncbi:Nonsense-mediated mRNA decay protein 2 isoform 1 [Rhynchospora pubera]|uniref:Nonsense-mediated mRNA decay protein 2 isoform 1 n=1 Tax=Rhynchospora pubera TaxID=906938 RepID=A0AAV8HAB5_9POAL|nr:Nonsense-mediated mRNA decay protein 2 isoform 1 [Rhynchospora pubera]
MGKNQAYKAMQRARVGSSSAGPKDVEDGMADGSFHSPEWHAARLASLQTSHTVTWEEFKRKQKEDELKKGEIEADKDRMMREYRAQLDAERAQKLAQGRNHSKFSFSKKDRKDKDMKKRSKRKRKHRRSSDSSSSSSSSSEYSSSDSEVGVRDSKRSRSKSRSKRSKKEKRKHRSRSKTKHSSESDDEENGGPVRLSKFFGCAKD